MSRIRFIALAAALLGCGAAGAHEGATTAFARIVISGSTVRYSLTLADPSRLGPAAQDPATLAQAVRSKVRVANDGGPCVPTTAELVPPVVSQAGATVVVDFACRGAVRTLSIRDDLPDALGAELHALAKVEWPGGTAQFAFAAESRDARFDVGTGQPPTRGVASFFWLGVEHILTGYDHLLFLLVLALGGGGAWALVKIVTAFTVAHSVTLALAVLGIATLPDRLVEAAIALSIAYVAGENLFAKRALSRRWMVSFAFGLVHGFGFAAALRELGLTAEHLAWSLAAFNVGVEAGQAVIVLPLVWLLLRLRGRPWEPKVAAALSAVVLAVGLALFVERVAFAG